MEASWQRADRVLEVEQLDIDSSEGTIQAKQIMQWGAEGVIVGSALVKALGDAASPQEGLKAMETLAKSIREAI